jgi:CheY-like chemotaxis protein/anti-sigma regulatory factor (Ser/Thr protein kinase)
VLETAHKDTVKTLRKSGRHLATLVDDVLDMSRIEAGRIELVVGPFDLGATLEEVVHMFAAQAAASGTELTLEPSTELPRSLLGDGGKVKQIVINLVSNAVKFTRAGSIRVTAKSSDRIAAAADADTLVEIVVADTGIGIEEEDRARMFKPFEQLEDGARAGGTGLGLAISLAFARLMSGDLTVESAPGKGSRFKLTFMARVAPETAPSAGEHWSPFGSVAARYKVLIVDDMQVNRDLLADQLAKLGVYTRTAANGPAALALHADWDPDVVLMDLRMPWMDGIETIKRLRAAGSRAVIGALTASALWNDEREVLGVGADFFLRKPYDGRDLLDRLGNLLETRTAAARGRQQA